MEYPLTKSLVKRSRKRVVISGDVAEVYEYELPFYFNLPVRKRIETRNKDRERRADNLANARTKIRRTIQANVNAYGCKPVFVTYTFKDNIKDLNEANKIFTNHIKRLNRELYGGCNDTARYISVVEFQKRGAIHYHVLYFNMPFISQVKQKFTRLWGKGFIQIKAIKHVDNIGAYVCKYLQKETIDFRLVGRKAFFCSRGLIKPIEYRREHEIDELIKTWQYEESYRKEYKTERYGSVIYKQIKLNQKK